MSIVLTKNREFGIRLKNLQDIFTIPRGNKSNAVRYGYNVN
jgi:hypothetical protein